MSTTLTRRGRNWFLKGQFETLIHIDLKTVLLAGVRRGVLILEPEIVITAPVSE